MTETIVSNLHPAYTYVCRVSAVTVDVGVFSGNVTLQMEEAGTYIRTSLSFLIYLIFYMRSSIWTPSQYKIDLNISSIYQIQLESAIA